MPTPFWLTALCCMLLWMAVPNSLIIGSTVLQVRYGFSMDDAGFFFTLPYIVAGIIAVPLGWFVSKCGYRKLVCISGMLLMAVGHGLNIYLPDCDQCW
jgi:fucose permease